MSGILLSILIPAYNTSAYIGRCLDSIINSYEKAKGNDLEIICVDDGSKDNTWEILQEYALKYKYIQVFHKKNGGVGSARNEALKHVKGEYIGWADSDDFVSEEWYPSISSRLRSEHPDCLLIDYCLKKGDKIIQKNINLGEKVTRQQFIYEQSLQHELGNFLFLEFIRADLWNGITFPNLHMLEDMTVLTGLIPQYERIYHIKRNLYYYVMNEGSLTHNITPDTMWSNIQVVKSRYEKYEKLGYAYSSNDLLEQLLGYWYHPDISSDKRKMQRKEYIRNIIKVHRQKFTNDPGVSKKSKIKLNCIYFHLDDLLEIILKMKRFLR